MKTSVVIFVLAALLTGSTALALEKQAYMMREDLGRAPLFDNSLQYYYYIPCPEFSWFWAFSGWTHGDVSGDIIGAWFEIGDLSTGPYASSDPVECHTLGQLRVLDFAGYGTTHPGLFTVEFDIYCSDEYGCPVGPSLWNSGPRETGYAWNYFDIDPPLSICPCATDPGPPPSAPRILITISHVGSSYGYPSWGCDNISSNVQAGCILHDYGCLPVLYPRPYVSHYTAVHSGYYGQGFEYCPPQLFKDPDDTTPDGGQYGFLELAWRISLICSGPTEAATTTWGDIKAMYE